MEQPSVCAGHVQECRKITEFTALSNCKLVLELGRRRGMERPRLDRSQPPLTLHSPSTSGRRERQLIRGSHATFFPFLEGESKFEVAFRNWSVNRTVRLALAHGRRGELGKAI